MSFTYDENAKMIEVSVKFTEQEWQSFLLMTGLIMGTIRAAGHTELAYSFLRLLNKMNEGNPNWVPYWLPAEEMTHA